MLNPAGRSNVLLRLWGFLGSAAIEGVLRLAGALFAVTCRLGLQPLLFELRPLLTIVGARRIKGLSKPAPEFRGKD